MEKTDTRKLQSANQNLSTTYQPSNKATANTAIVPMEVVNHVITDRDRSGVLGLSDEQWKSTLQALNSIQPSTSEPLSGKISNSNWILDSEASHHMTGNLSRLSEIRNIAPIGVILADGSESIATQEGSFRISSDLILKSVLHVSRLTSDLISVGQLLDENGCVIQIADTFLVIQDRLPRMVIGVGKRKGGTFYFQEVFVASAVTTRAREIDLWHCCYGHPSDKILASVLDFGVVSSNKACVRFRND